MTPRDPKTQPPSSPGSQKVVKNTILESLAYWMPFIQVNNIDVKMSDNQGGTGRNTIEVSTFFSLKID